MTKPSTNPVRVGVALLLAAFIGCAAGLCSLPILVGAIAKPESFDTFLKTLFLIWGTTLPVSLIFGAFAHWALLRLKLWPVTAYTITGILLGPVSILVWDIAMSRSLHFKWLPPELIWLGVITGGVTALTFRLLVNNSNETPSFPPAGTRPY